MIERACCFFIRPVWAVQLKREAFVNFSRTNLRRVSIYLREEHAYKWSLQVPSLQFGQRNHRLASCSKMSWKRRKVQFDLAAVWKRRIFGTSPPRLKSGWKVDQLSIFSKVASEPGLVSIINRLCWMSAIFNLWKLIFQLSGDFEYNTAGHPKGGLWCHFLQGALFLRS